MDRRYTDGTRYSGCPSCDRPQVPMRDFPSAMGSSGFGTGVIRSWNARRTVGQPSERYASRISTPATIPVKQISPRTCCLSVISSKKMNVLMMRRTTHRAS